MTDTGAPGDPAMAMPTSAATAMRVSSLSGTRVAPPSRVSSRARFARVPRAVASSETTTAEAPRMVTVEERLGAVFPSNLRCALRVNVPLTESEEAGRSLSEYMRLPVDQYVGIDLPMGAEMKRVPEDPDLFQLEIPGLKFLSLEVKPVVRVRVRLVEDGQRVDTWTGQSGFPGGRSPEWRAAEAARIAAAREEAEAARAACDDDDAAQLPEECVDDDAAAAAADADPDATVDDTTADELEPTPKGRPEREDVDLRGPCVLIEAVSCRVEGEVVEELGVNDLFVFRGTTCFRWLSRGDGSLGGADLTRTGPGGEVEPHADDVKTVGKVKDGEACISGWADIGVGVDPPGPFALLPNAFAEKVGDTVMRTTLKALQTVFLKGLAKDYAKWATDAEYRAAREVAAAKAKAEAEAASGDA